MLQTPNAGGIRKVAHQQSDEVKILSTFLVTMSFFITIFVVPQKQPFPLQDDFWPSISPAIMKTQHVYPSKHYNHGMQTDP